MNAPDLSALVAETVDAYGTTTASPFDTGKVELRVLNHPSVAGYRGTEAYEDLQDTVQQQAVQYLGAKTDEAGQRVYFAGRGQRGRYVWYPVRLIHDRANGDQALLAKLLHALERQDAEYLAR